MIWFGVALAIYLAGGFFFAGAFLACQGCYLSDLRRAGKPAPWTLEDVLPVLVAFWCWPVCLFLIYKHGWR